MIDQLFAVAFALVLAAAIAFCLWSIRDMRAAHRIAGDQIRELRHLEADYKAVLDEIPKWKDELLSHANILHAGHNNRIEFLERRIEALETNFSSEPGKTVAQQFELLNADTEASITILFGRWKGLDSRVEALESHSRSLTEWADEAACVDEEYQQAESQGEAS